MAVEEIIYSIMFQNFYADKAIEYNLKKNKKWGSRDRAFIAEAVYEIVRWWRKIAFECGILEPNETHLKRIITQFFKNIYENLPDYEGIWDFTNYTQNTKNYNEKAVDLSVPDWIFELGSKELGENVWIRELNAMNKMGDVCLRFNTLKADAKTIQQALLKEGIYIKPHSFFNDIFVLCEKKNIFQSHSYKSGLIEIQDAGSQQIAPFLSPTPGARVIDACAGAGGKTLHLSALMHNTGQIIALDIEEWKLGELKKRAKRAGATNILVRHIRSAKIIKRLKNSADYLLLDVPCSGLGVLKRNPDAKWKLKPDFIKELNVKQNQILRNYASLLKVNGIMVYATCSLLPSENENVVNKFLRSEEGKNFEKLDEKTLYPSIHETDGFYMCKLKKKQ
jgi:16S rRNA (cytosine967-C5)-methyltransferase